MPKHDVTVFALVLVLLPDPPTSSVLLPLPPLDRLPQTEWEQELVDFCQSYRFHRRGERVLGVKIEETRCVAALEQRAV